MASEEGKRAAATAKIVEHIEMIEKAMEVLVTVGGASPTVEHMFWEQYGMKRALRYLEEEEK